MRRRHKDLFPPEADIRYLSTAKLNGFCLGAEKRGFGFGISGLLSLSCSSRKKSERELLSEVCRHLQKLGIVHDEEPGDPGTYFVTRFLGRCGLMWPAFGANPGLHDVTWWLGRSENYRVFAYGSRVNLRDQGGAAEREEATWYPSEARAYEELLDTITAEVHGNVKGESSSYALREAAISHLMDYCFDDAVEHGKTLMSQAVYQILMRLDGVDLEDSNQPVVYGSPIAVARVPGIVPGRYCTGKHPQQIDGVDATAVWNGKEWEKPRWRDHRDPRAMSRNPLTGLPALPNEAPTSITNLISLSLN